MKKGWRYLCMQEVLHAVFKSTWSTLFVAIIFISDPGTETCLVQGSHRTCTAGAVYEHFPLTQVELHLRWTRKMGSLFTFNMFSWELRQWLPCVSCQKNVWKVTWVVTDSQTHRLPFWASKSCGRQKLTAAFHDDRKLSSRLHGWCEAKAFCLLMESCINFWLQVRGSFSVLYHCFTIPTLTSQTVL